MTESTTGPIPLEQFEADMFRPIVGRAITFERPPSAPGAERQPLDLTLVQVSVSAHPGGGKRRQPFSLLFSLRDQAPLNDRLLHRLSHPGFESCELLVSRVFVPELDRRDGTMYYEAVFA